MNRKLISSICLALTLVSCTSLRKLDRKSISGGDFNAYLAEGYRNFADSEADYADWVSVEHFARKGLAATKGTEVLPEDLSKRRLAPNVREELANSRSQLELFFNSGIKLSDPKRAADAQVFYDCWVEQSEEGWESKKIKECKEGFNQAISNINLIEIDTSDVGSYTQYLPPEDYVVYFEPGSTKYTKNAQEMIRHVSNVIKNLSDIRYIKIRGFTDNVGLDADNDTLASQRAEKVASELVDLGVDINLIKTESYGSHNLAYPTSGKQTDVRNRRVQIDIFQ